MEMNEATRQFIRQHADEDVRQLALRFSARRFPGQNEGWDDADGAIDLPLALDQIRGRQLARRKLPTWAAIDGIAYPPHLSMEQCSSEQTAFYKAQLLARLVNDWNEAHGTNSLASLIDLTGGFGVDFAFMARSTSRAVYVERNPMLCDIARHNFPLLGLEHAEVVSATAEDILRTGLSSVQGEAGVRAVFLDPARRDEHGLRTYGIADCTPNVLFLRDDLFKNADFIVLKLSPMLDWRAAVNELGRQNVAEVHIVSVDNECKEMLLVMCQNVDETALFCVNLPTSDLSGGEQCFSLKSIVASLEPLSCAFPEAGQYLYEPNASLMKAGCFGAVSRHYAIAPIARDSHLFVQSNKVTKYQGNKVSFPGRVFRIEAVTTMGKRELRQALLGITQTNIAIRNFPMKPDELRRKLKLRDGGDTYIFGTTLSDGRHVLLVCEKA